MECGAEVERREVERQDCFLCDPLAALVFDSEDTAFAMAGLGPLVDGYSIVATHKHVETLSHLSEEEFDAYLAYVAKVRAYLSLRYGSCLLTEHGRMPVCSGSSGASIGHCFHPHFLLFPAAPNIQAAAIDFLGTPAKVNSLREAIRMGNSSGQYLLISPDPQTFFVYRAISNLPRQILRLFVAEALGLPDAASWRDFPHLSTACETAAEHREDLESKHAG